MWSLSIGGICCRWSFIFWLEPSVNSWGWFCGPLEVYQWLHVKHNYRTLLASHAAPFDLPIWCCVLPPIALKPAVSLANVLPLLIDCWNESITIVQTELSRIAASRGCWKVARCRTEGTVLWIGIVGLHKDICNHSIEPARGETADWVGTGRLHETLGGSK